MLTSLAEHLGLDCPGLANLEVRLDRTSRNYRLERTINHGLLQIVWRLHIFRIKEGKN